MNGQKSEKHETAVLAPRKQRKNRSRLASPIVGAALLASAATGMVASPASASEPAKANKAPGIGEIFSVGETIFNAVDHCLTNEGNNIDCLQSDSETLGQIHQKVGQIYDKLDAFTKQYAVDVKHTNASFAAIYKAQTEEYVRSQWRDVQSDMETSHLGLRLYDSYLDCLTKATSGVPNQKCKTVDKFGNERGNQVADLQTVYNIQQEMIKNEEPDRTGAGGYKLRPTDFVQRMSGTSLNPYDSASVMSAVLKDKQAQLRQDQGITVGTKVNFYPAAFVNGLGEEENRLIELQRSYFANRIIVAQMMGDEELADDLAALAEHGRNDSSRVLSLGQQAQTFLFPNWTPDNQLNQLQAYFIGPKGAWLLTNHGNHAEADTKLNLPTAEQIKQMADAVGEAGTTWDNIGRTGLRGIPTSLPETGRGNPDAAARFWAAPQPIIKAHLYGEWENGKILDPNQPGFGKDSREFWWPQTWYGVGGGEGLRQDWLDLDLIDGSTVSIDGRTYNGHLSTKTESTGSVQYAAFDKPTAMPNEHNGWVNIPGGRWTSPGASAAYSHPVWDLYRFRHFERIGPSRSAKPEVSSPLGRGSSVIVSGSVKPGKETPLANNLDIQVVDAGGVIQF